MSLSISPPKVSFLFDENVDHRLLKFLKEREVDIILKSKGLDNSKLAEFSKLEQRVFVTNDEDFINSEKFTKSEIFSVVWLKISQSKIESAKLSFSKLLKELKPEDFKGKLIILYENRFELSELTS